MLVAPTVWDRLPLVLGPAAVDRLLESPDSKTRLGRRDRAALETLYATGCRASEVVGLRPVDLDLTTGMARCVGKGNKERRVPLGSRAILALADYLKRDRPVLVARRPETATVFVSRSGRPLSRNGAVAYRQATRSQRPGSTGRRQPAYAPAQLCDASSRRRR